MGSVLRRWESDAQLSLGVDVAIDIKYAGRANGRINRIRQYITAILEELDGVNDPQAVTLANQLNNTLTQLDTVQAKYAAVLRPPGPGS